MACEQLKAELAELRAERTDLQAELQMAPPGMKAFLVSQIKALSKALVLKQRELDSCLVHTPPPWFTECTPKILVVTDSLSFQPTASFGLTEFVATLRASPIHSMTPRVITALYNPSPSAVLTYDAINLHITNFKFTDSTHGLRKSRYDVVFILSINGGNGSFLASETGALDAITAFMQAGGGVFATGDHEDLGAGMCTDIPRVRNMRYWTSGVPSAGGDDRLTTNLPGRGDVAGSNDEYEFSDQSDQFPQRLFVNFRTTAGGIGAAHPLLQVPASNRAIEVFPDHPHEGECVVPSNLTTKLADGVTDEWPVAVVGGARVSPEMAALTMSHGNAFPSKEAVTPRSFIAICAYDGQRANVGRVVTDATWHHFININIKPGMSMLAGRDLTDIKQYYKNLAVWLMPKNVRMCRRYPWILSELMRYPLFEEIRPIPRKKLDAPMLRDIGVQVEAALLSRYTRAEVNALVDDALEEAIGPEAKHKLDELGIEFGRVSAVDTGLAALGSLTMASAERFNELKGESKLDGEKAFAEIVKVATAEGVRLYLSHSLKTLKQGDKIIDLVIRGAVEKPKHAQ
jgi:hypothetical protein